MYIIGSMDCKGGPIELLLAKVKSVSGRTGIFIIQFCYESLDLSGECIKFSPTLFADCERKIVGVPGNEDLMKL